MVVARLAPAAGAAGGPQAERQSPPQQERPWRPAGGRIPAHVVAAVCLGSLLAAASTALAFQGGGSFMGTYLCMRVYV